MIVKDQNGAVVTICRYLLNTRQTNSKMNLRSIRPFVDPHLGDDFVSFKRYYDPFVFFVFQ
ncbi:MAG TPA: hypothetical protein DEB17_02390 [Chlorobaculum sp.]|uniref:Uncharacterized protein n=1 Tax=Chlorobaculum tepidum (strain ATCC 49652 / DSM 12025 / NBRC 103806 / TLS) TaxID=194439 RepID=Q8KEJ6_CHLTE|nr:hypothetical protein CT0692 [Chlorobaculum tepidum TLS]HBU22846.1 hypothetical protein [Chlorobaculum sp.]